MNRSIAIVSATLLSAILAVPALAQDVSPSKKSNKGMLKTAQSAATNSSMVGIDPGRGLAFVARDKLGGASGDGLVDVISLKANPNKKDPRKATIDIGHADFPIGVAVDVADQTLIVVSGDNGHGGFLDGFVEKTLQHLGPFPFPAGSDTGAVGQVIFDPVRKNAIVATITSGHSSSTLANATTGFSVFSGSSFGPIIPANSSDNFAFNALTNVVISPADADEPPIDAVDITNGVGCTTDLADTSIQSQKDPDAAGFDPATNVVVIGEDNNTKRGVAVTNLNGATFENEGMPPCRLIEGGSAPNSVSIDASFTSPAGVAINLKTHQALIEQSDGSGVALIQLPTVPVAQIDTSKAFLISHAGLPDDPSGAGTKLEGFPYAAAVDSKHNLGYGRERDTYLVRISLKTLKSNAAAIGSALPAGNCKGTSTTVACSNGPVTFFPLSDTTAE